MIIVAGLAVLVVLIILALDDLVTSAGTSGKNGASDAIALITAGGAVLTGLVGLYFGINVSHQSATAAQQGQIQANVATQTANNAAINASKVAVKAAAAIDPTSNAAIQLIQSL